MQSSKSKIKISYFLAATLSLSGALFAGGVSAQAVLEEVIVTAEKREQTIQELPISIEAFDAERLDTLQISGFEDIQQHVTGLYGGPNSADVGGVKIYIRGVGTGDPQVGLDARLALYVDGVYVGKTVGLAFDAVDLERVEILKGPQGTLYGRNAVGGAINLISKKADPSEFDAKASVTAGNYSAFRVKGHVNMPLAENLAVKFSAYISELDGWVENKGAGEDFAGHEREGARLDVAFIPNDQMRFDYSYEYTDSENQPLLYQSLPGTAELGQTAGAGFSYNYANYLVPGPDGKRQDDVNANFGYNSGREIDTGQIETEAHTLLGRWDWAENHYAKLLVGWRKVEATRYNVFWPEVNRDCIDQTRSDGEALCTATDETLAEFLNRMFFTGSPPTGTSLLSYAVGLMVDDGGTQKTLQDAFLDNVSLAGNSNGGGADTLMDPAESWSVELNQIGELLDGRLEYTGGFYYFKEEIENATDPYPYGAFGLFAGTALPMALHVGAHLRTAGIATNGAIRGFACTALSGTYDRANSECTGPTEEALAERVTELSTLYGESRAGASLTAAEQATVTQLEGAINPAVQAALASAAPVLSSQGKFELQSARSGTSPLGWELDTEAWALFGQATWTPEGFDDRLHVTFGARYSFDDKQADFQTAFVFPRGSEIPAGATTVGGTTTLTTDSLKEDNDWDSFDPMVRVVWDLDENSIVYASISQGFLSGGYNVTAAGTEEGLRDTFTFDKQNILAYEVGFKGDLMNRRLRINAAAFYYEIDDDQFPDQHPTDPTSRNIANVDSDFEGAELSVTYIFNEALTINFQYAYLDTSVDTFTSAYPTSAGAARTVSRSSVGAPENTVNISLDYNAPLAQVLPWLGQDGDFHAYLGYNHADDAFSSNQNPRDQYDLFNAEVGISIPHNSGTLKVALWAQNLFDNEYWIDSLGAGSQSSINGFGYAAVIYGEPRTYGLTVSYDYD